MGDNSNEATISIGFPKAPRLPLELIEAVVDYFHDDEPSLLFFTYVCRLWTHRARTHLIQSLTLYCDRKRTRKIIASLDLCLAKDPSLGEYVHHLHIIHPPSSNSVLTREKYNSLVRILDRLSNIRHFSLQDIHWQRLPGNLKLSLLKILKHPTLSHLHLSGISASEPKEYAKLFGIPSRLKSLTLHCLWCEKGKESNESVERLALKLSDNDGSSPLRTLNITNLFDFWLLHSLFKTPRGPLNMGSLCHLCLDGSVRPHTAGQLLRVVGRSLQRLEINVFHPPGSTWIYEQMDIHLTDLPSLLHLVFLDGVSWPSIEGFFKDMHQKHPLEHITIVLPGEFDLGGWSEPYYLQPGLENLRMIGYQVLASYLESNGDSEFKAVFPNLYQRGLISVHAIAASSS